MAYSRQTPRLSFFRYLYNTGFPPFVFPTEDHRVGVDLFEVQMDAINQFLFGGDADTTQHAARHLAEHGFHDVQPRSMFRREDKLKSLGMKAEPSLRFFRYVRRVIVEQEANPGLRRIALVEFA